MRLDELKNERLETPEFIHNMIQCFRNGVAFFSDFVEPDIVHIWRCYKNNCNTLHGRNLGILINHQRTDPLKIYTVLNGRFGNTDSF